MKKLILIISLVLPFLASAQDYRVIDWKTDVLNVQTINTDTFKFETEIKDYNDPGAITREIGNYFIDFVFRCFKIIDSDATTITVVDLEHINSAPQSNQIGRVYQSVVDADSLFESIGGVDISVLDQMSIYRDVARNNEIICRLLKELYLKDATYRQKTDHDSLSMLDEKSYTSLTDKPDLTSYRQKTDHDSLSALDEKSYNSLTDKPNVFLGGSRSIVGDANTFNSCGAGFYVPTDLNTPFAGYGNIFNIDGYGQGLGNGWNTQLGFSTAYDNFAIRSSINNNTSWSNWKTIYHSGNSNNQTTPWTASQFNTENSLIANDAIIVGYGRSGNNYAYIDLIGDQTYNNYGVRLIRGNTGANATSAFVHRGKGSLQFITYEAGIFEIYTKYSLGLLIDTLQNSGFGTPTPAARIHSQSTTTQLRLGYDATKYTDLSTNSAGTFNISPSGGFTAFSGGISASAFSTFTGQVEMTGLDVNLGASTILRKNGSDIFTAPITMGACGSAGQVLSSTGPNSAPTWTTPATGSGSGITSIGMQVPTGLTVSPSALTANGTFTFGLQSGYSIPTTANQTNWSTAYSQRLISVSASYPMYLSLTNNVLTGYLNNTLTNFGGVVPSVGYPYWNGSNFSYQAATTTYTLPTASNSTLGGIQVSSTDGGLAMSGNYLLQKDNVLTTRTPEVSDYIAFYDNSATAQGKMTLSTLGSLIGGGGSGLWTSTSGGMYYNSGSVSIGTTDVGAIRLKVYSSNTANTFEAENSTWADAIRGYNSGEGTGVSGSSQTGIGGEFSSASSFGIRCFGTGMQLGSGAGIWSINSGTRIINPNGSFSPPSLADNVAANNSMYYSTTQNKLVYKDPSGSVHPLY